MLQESCQLKGRMSLVSFEEIELLHDESTIGYCIASVGIGQSLVRG